MYVGNMNGFDNNTYCECGNLLIKRDYSGKVLGISDNKCNKCLKEIYGKF